MRCEYKLTIFRHKEKRFVLEVKMMNWDFYTITIKNM